MFRDHGKRTAILLALVAWSFAPWRDCWGEPKTALAARQRSPKDREEIARLAGAVVKHPADVLDQHLPFRMVGALAMSQQFFPARVPGHYDALISFDRTRAPVCFRVKK